jgi:hypothetical protein
MKNCTPHNPTTTTQHSYCLIHHHLRLSSHPTSATPSHPGPLPLLSLRLVRRRRPPPPSAFRSHLRVLRTPHAQDPSQKTSLSMLWADTCRPHPRHKREQNLQIPTRSSSSKSRRDDLFSSFSSRCARGEKLMHGSEFSSKDLKNVGNYTLGRLIGKGSFGKVYLATHKLTNGSKVCTLCGKTACFLSIAW